jgi:hypothetical protein
VNIRRNFLTGVQIRRKKLGKIEYYLANDKRCGKERPGLEHSLKNRTSDRTGEAVGSGFYWSNHWFTGSLSGFLS